MQVEKILMIVCWFVMCGLWSMSIWGGWAEKAYERKKERYWPWYWLRLFNIPLTRKNCVRFLQGTSILGILLITLGTLLVLFFG